MPLPLLLLLLLPTLTVTVNPVLQTCTLSTTTRGYLSSGL